MDTRALEEAYEAFSAGDVSVEQHLSLRFAGDIDNDAFVALQEQARGGSKTEKREAAEELSKLLAGIPSSTTWDGVVACAFDAADAYGEALELRRRALLCAASWHPLEAPRLLGNIAYDLFQLGEHTESIRWLERALGWDPTNPYVLETLAESSVALGDAGRAAAIREYLSDRKYPKEHFGPIDAAMKSRKLKAPSGTRPYAPAHATLRRLDETGFWRFAAACTFDTGLLEMEQLRGHALACAMRQRLDVAVLAARAATQAKWGGFKELRKIQEAWAKAVDEAIDGFVPGLSLVLKTGGAFALDPEKRFQHLQKVAASGARAIQGMLFDPHPAIRVSACAQLLELGDESGVPYLEELAQVERRMGQDVARGGVTASALLRELRRREAPAPTELLLIPEEGPEHPLFGELAPGEALSIMLTFARSLRPPEVEKLQSTMEAVDAAAAWASGGATPRISVQGAEGSLHLVVAGVNEPQKKASAVLRVFKESGLPVREVMLARFTLPEDETSDWHALDDPRMPPCEYYDDNDARWEALFDPRKTAPASEPEGGLFIMMPNGQGGYVRERRNAQLFVPGVRISYFTPEVDYPEVDAGEPRRAEVQRDVLRSLEHAFRGARPPIRDREGQANTVDVIERTGRRGYAFALEGQTEEMIVHYPGSFRYREYELMIGLRDAIRTLRLAPVINWYREGGLYILNVWERLPGEESA
jgi:tetratricopeptide (TPR) repeat protein